MEYIDKDKLLGEIGSFSLPTYNEIPNVGLFLEQVTKYITEYMAPIESVSITASMISNYVKKKIVANPVKKQYDRELIGNLIFIAVAKTVLSLEDIQQLLQLSAEELGYEKMYELFREELLDTLQAVFAGNGTEQLMPEEEASTSQRLLRHTVNTVAHKIYLDKSFKIIRE